MESTVSIKLNPQWIFTSSINENRDDTWYILGITIHGKILFGLKKTKF